MERHMVGNILITAEALSETYSLLYRLDLKVAGQCGNVTIDLRKHPISPEAKEIYGLIPYGKITSTLITYRPTSCTVTLHVSRIDIDVLSNLRNLDLII